MVALPPPEPVQLPLVVMATGRLDVVAAFTKNVRLCRRNGPADVPFERLTALAWETIQAASKRNGWAVPADHVVGLEPLDGEKDS